MSVNINYEHFVPAVKPDPNFKEKVRYHLIGSMQELKETLLRMGPYIAWDTETSSLNPEEGFIVGFSFAENAVDGYYVPVRHAVGNSLGPTSLSMFYKFLCTRKMTFLYNARFDMRFMEYAGIEGEIDSFGNYTTKYDMSKVHIFDAMTAVWNSDTNVKLPSLKWAEEHFLGWKADKFLETLGDAENFYYVDPEDAYPYGSQDAIGLFAVVNATMKYHQEAGVAGRLDNEILYPMMKFENSRIPLSKELLEKYRDDVTEHLKELEHEIYAIAGTVFKIGSGHQLTDIFEKLGIDTGRRVKNGDMKTDMKLLAQVDKESPHPILSKLIEYKTLFKAYNSYIDPLCKEADTKGYARFSYQLANVPTGRFSCGADKKNHFFTPLNFQSIPKPHTTTWYVREATQEEIDNEEDILGYHFSLTEKSNHIIEGFDPKLNVRRAFEAGRGNYTVVLDMAGEELRVNANVFGIRAWLNTFKVDGDVHGETARLIFGDDYTKTDRKKAKVADFGIAYGMNAAGFHEKFPEMSIEECEEFMAKFNAAIPELAEGQNYAIRRARKTGTVSTVFGRPRRVRSYLNSSESRVRSFGNRTVKNTLIQGASGDALRLMIVRIWRELFQKYPGVRWLGTIHDEIDYVVPRDIIYEVLPILIKCQTITLPQWEVPLIPGLSVGTSFGNQFDFTYDVENGKYVPDWTEVKEESTAPTQEEDEYSFNDLVYSSDEEDENYEY